MERTPFWCRLGFHRWYMDGAMFTAADRCDRCDRWKNPSEGAAVERERAAWTSEKLRLDQGKPFDQGGPDAGSR